MTVAVSWLEILYVVTTPSIAVHMWNLFFRCGRLFPEWQERFGRLSLFSYIHFVCCIHRYIGQQGPGSLRIGRG
jgi:hypothetical protein